MRNSRRYWRAMLIAIVAAGALSGCYYDPYTGYYSPYPPYPYPMGYPYGYGYPYPPQPGPGANPAPGAAPYAGAPYANPQIQSAPLPPPPAY
jgi:hypothetical protein